MADAVKVAVRVRPFIHDYEKVDGIKCIVTMDKETQTTTITHPETGKTRSFTFDFSYNSFLPETDPAFASQDTVWNDLGIGVLENAWQGFNVSLFAYGQTGAGKSHSMMGYPGSEGIVPRACREIFQRIDRCKEASAAQGEEATQFKIEASMLEIYNEKVRDLFNPEQGGSGGLKVRDHPKTGPYVQGLTKLAVDSYEGINEAMEAGTRARTVAATAMNATSSRAHTIFQILLTQTTVDKAAGKATDKVSVISLIDLAGSERANRTGAAGDRLKEGCAINQSLSSLGNVISALAEKATDPRKAKIVVPYRSSALTHLLKNSLGGNAKTIMIAAVSPSNVNYDETLGTLRYADRAKKIKNKAVVNEDPNVKLIRGLQEEIEALRQALQLREAGAAPGRPATADAQAAKVDVEELRKAWEAEKEREMARMKDQLMENQRLLVENQKSWDQKLQDAAVTTDSLAQRASTADPERGRRDPHLRNVHEDPQMSGVLWYFLQDVGPTLVGRQDAPGEQHIQLSGLGILKEHCVLHRAEGDAPAVSVAPAAGAKVFINGRRTEAAEALHHGDRLILGNNQAFVVHLPWEAARLAPAALAQLEAQATWEHVEREQSEAQLSKITQAERQAREEAEREAKEMQRKVAALEQRMQREREKAVQAAAAASAAERQRLQENQQRLEAELAARIEETEALRQRQERDQVRQRLLEDTVSKTIHLLDEANEMSEELAMKTVFTLQLVARHGASTGAASPVHTARSRTSNSLPVEDVEDSIRATMETEVCVRAEVLGSDRPAALWPRDKFVNRLYLMREMYQDFVEVGRDLALLHESYSDDVNPFVDPDEAQVIGKAYIMLDSLAYFLDIDDSPPIINFKGKAEGLVKVRVSLDPAQVERFEQLGGAAEEPTLADAVGQTMTVNVEVRRCKGLPPKLCENVHVAYQLGGVKYATPPCQQRSTSPDIRDLHTFQVEVTEEFAAFVIGGGSLELQVLGSPVTEPLPAKSPKKRPGSRSPTKRRRRKDQNDARTQEESPHDAIPEDQPAQPRGGGKTDQTEGERRASQSGGEENVSQSKGGENVSQWKGEEKVSQSKGEEKVSQSKGEEHQPTANRRNSNGKRRNSIDNRRRNSGERRPSAIAISTLSLDALPPIAGAMENIPTSPDETTVEATRKALDQVKQLESHVLSLQNEKEALEKKLADQAAKLRELEMPTLASDEEKKSADENSNPVADEGQQRSDSKERDNSKYTKQLEQKELRIQELEEKMALFEASAATLAELNPEAHKAALAAAEKYKLTSPMHRKGNLPSEAKDSTEHGVKQQAVESSTCSLQ